jgi:uncharacterized protein YndB with AHSA1/START domain
MKIVDKKIEIIKLIPANQKSVWEKWTTRKGINSFFGSESKIELTLGGSFEVYFNMDIEYGLRGSEGSIIISYLPYEMLSFTWNAPPSIMEVRNSSHKSWVVIFLDKIDELTTELKFTHYGWLEGASWDESFNYFTKAWEYVINNLIKSIEEENK